jgi:hypothetical protein
MWEWITSLAAIVQAIFAGLLFVITWYYVRLTRQLVAAQVEPGFFLEQSGQSAGMGTSESVTVRNLGKNEIVNVTATSRAYGVAKDGVIFPIWGPDRFEKGGVFVKELKGGDSFECSFARCLATAKIYHDAVELDRNQGRTDFPAKCGVIVEVRYQRKVDLKIYQDRLRLVFLWREGEFSAMDAALFGRDLEPEKTLQK